MWVIFTRGAPRSWTAAPDSFRAGRMTPTVKEGHNRTRAAQRRSIAQELYDGEGVALRACKRHLVVDILCVQSGFDLPLSWRPNGFPDGRAGHSQSAVKGFCTGRMHPTLRPAGGGEKAGRAGLHYRLTLALMSQFGKIMRFLYADLRPDAQVPRSAGRAEPAISRVDFGVRAVMPTATISV
jgi:hypothetical protein